MVKMMTLTSQICSRCMVKSIPDMLKMHKSSGNDKTVFATMVMVSRFYGLKLKISAFWLP